MGKSLALSTGTASSPEKEISPQKKRLEKNKNNSKFTMSDTKKSSFSQLKITLEQVHEYNHQISKHIAVMLRNYKVEKEAGQND